MIFFVSTFFTDSLEYSFLLGQYSNTNSLEGFILMYSDLFIYLKEKC